MADVSGEAHGEHSASISGRAMKPSLYLSYGMTKCGSTLAFKLTRELYAKNGHEQARLPEAILDRHRSTNFVPFLTDEKVDAILDIVERDGATLVLKSHTPPSDAVKQLLADGRAIGHAIFRDPREMALSMLDHGVRSRGEGVAAFADLIKVGDCIERIERQIGYFNEWADLPGIKPWFYDDFAWDQEGLLERVKDQAGLKGSPAKLLAGFDDTHHMQFNKGTPARWKTDMSKEDSDAYLAHFADFYARFDDLRSYWRTWTPPKTGLLSRLGLG